MEDAHLIHYFERLEPDHSSAALFGIYDGHGGPQVSQFVSHHLVDELLKNPDFRRGGKIHTDIGMHALWHGTGDPCSSDAFLFPFLIF